jgi:FixJ family two-component response regulator
MSAAVPELLADAKPIVFVIHKNASVSKWLATLIHEEGWQPETHMSVQEFLVRPRAVVPNCLVLDASLSGLNGLELQKHLRMERPDMPIIFISESIDVPTTVKAMKAGAVEFFTKPFQDALLSSSMREALDRSRVALAHKAETQVLRDCYTSLTSREREVMAMVTAGLLNKQVAGELGICEGTVKIHRGRVMLKMKANSFADLVRIAERLGLPDGRPEVKTASPAIFSLLSSRNLKDRQEPAQSYSIAASVLSVEESALR